MVNTRHTLEELRDIASSTARFEAFIGGRDTLQGQTIDLIAEVVKLGYEVGGGELSDEAMLTMILDIVDAYGHYAATHDWN